jgi:hypothetical protein
MEFSLVIDVEILNNGELTPLDKFLLAWIGHFTRRGPGGSCFQSNAELAKELAASEGGIHKSLARLAKKEFIIIHHEGKIRHLISKFALRVDPDFSLERWKEAYSQSTFQVSSKHLSGAPESTIRNSRLLVDSSSKCSPTPKLPQRDVQKDYPEESYPYQLATILVDSVNVNMPGTYQRYLKVDGAMEVVLQNTAHQIHKLLADGKEQMEVLEVLQFSQTDLFWRENIRSGHKLRMQYEELLKQMKEEGIGSHEKDPNEALTKQIIGAFRALINNPKYNPPPKDYHKFVKASVCLRDFFDPREISTKSGVEYLLRCLDKEYGDKGMTIYAGNMCSDHTWNLLMPQYMLEIGV